MHLTSNALFHLSAESSQLISLSHLHPMLRRPRSDRSLMLRLDAPLFGKQRVLTVSRGARVEIGTLPDRSQERNDNFNAAVRCKKMS